jgi:hypothetical protein
MPPVINNNLKLPDDMYYPYGNIKTGICLHHTCGGTAASTIEWWKKDGKMVGTAYIIDRDGTIYQVFDPKGWAFQFGLKWGDTARINFEKRFIGIEIASEGGLIENGGNLYCFDTVSSRTLKNKNGSFDYGKVYRQYRYFDQYEKTQIDSVIQIVNHLCDSFNIERRIPSDYKNYYGDKLKDFKGVIGHVNIREDKTDPLPDDLFWQRVITECNLQKIDFDLKSVSPQAPLNGEQIQKLFQDNVAQFSKMNRTAANMVKGLLWELQDNGRNTYIRLKNAIENGHVVFYELVQGDHSLIDLAAQSLGFRSWDNNRLEVFNG